MLGGNVNNGLIDGVSALNVNNVPSNTNWNNGASHSYNKDSYNVLIFPHSKERKLTDEGTD
nr:MAG TPA: hypothetical protein [Caudoviricetes sp.]